MAGGRQRGKRAAPRAEPGTARTAGRAGTQAAPTSAEARREMIARAAYFRAERRGFAPGRELEDWLEAEAEVDAQLGLKPARG